MPGNVDGHDRPQPTLFSTLTISLPADDRLLYLLRIDIEVVLLDVHKHRRSPDILNGFGGAHKCVRGGDHLIAGPDVEPRQRQMHGCCTGIDSNGFPGSQIVCKRLFKRFHRRTGGEPAAFERFHHGLDVGGVDQRPVERNG